MGAFHQKALHLSIRTVHLASVNSVWALRLAPTLEMGAVFDDLQPLALGPDSAVFAGGDGPQAPEGALQIGAVGIVYLQGRYGAGHGGVSNPNGDLLMAVMQDDLRADLLRGLRFRRELVVEQLILGAVPLAQGRQPLDHGESVYSINPVDDQYISRPQELRLHAYLARNAPGAVARAVGICDYHMRLLHCDHCK